MDWTVAAYAVYLLVAVPLVVVVARALARHGRVLLEEGRGEDQARAVNRLLVAGTGLVDLGFVSLLLRGGADVDGLRGLVEQVSAKVGVVAVVIGVVHLLAVWTLSAMQRRHRADSWRAAFLAGQAGHAGPWVPPAPYAGPGH